MCILNQNKEEPMDLRIQRTKAAIKTAFLDLRSRLPIEKITVTELTRLADINKATFYLHYSDIYDLADKVEDGLIDEILENLNIQDNFFDNPKQYAMDIFKALVEQREQIDNIFSGSRNSLCADKIEIRIKNVLFKNKPEYHTIKNDAILAFLIQGIFHTIKTTRMSDGMDEKYRVLSELTDLVIAQIEQP